MRRDMQLDRAQWPPEMMPTHIGIVYCAEIDKQATSMYIYDLVRATHRLRSLPETGGQVFAESCGPCRRVQDCKYYRQLSL